MLDEEEMARAVREIDTVHVANMLEGGLSPIVPPQVLGQMGYGIALYGITLLLRIVKTMQAALADLRSGEMRLVGTGANFDDYLKVVGIDQWRAIEDTYGEAHPDRAMSGH
jgi:2-methylisocitrate lyase-like PEP mutase family enzyme